MNARSRVNDLQRRQIAQHAARLMADSGLRDIPHARRKAAQQLAIRDPASLPDESLVLQALHEHLRLFSPGSRDDGVTRFRAAAVHAMEFFHAFSPRLTGAVLEGTANEYSAVQLHLHSDEPEAIQRCLEDHEIPAQQTTAHLRLDHGRTSAVPCWHIDAEGIPFELMVLPERALRHPPLQSGSQQPLSRVSLNQLRKLVEAESDHRSTPLS
jgi:hypothetical protein